MCLKIFSVVVEHAKDIIIFPVRRIQLMIKILSKDYVSKQYKWIIGLILLSGLPLFESKNLP